MTPHEQRAVHVGNVLFVQTVALAREVAAAGGHYVIEHPEDPGRAPYASIFVMEPMLTLLKETKGELVSFDQCRKGAPTVKATTLATNSLGVARRFNGRRCDHGRGAHRSLQGKDPATGHFCTRASQTYPSEMCRDLAVSLVEDFVAAKKAGTAPPGGPLDWEALPHAALRARYGEAETPLAGPQPGERVPAPLLDPEWSNARRWKLTFSGRWTDREHISVLEARTVLLLARHLCRSRRTCQTRVLVLLDSMAALGCLSKGRSAVRPLLHLCRQLAGLTLFVGLRLWLRYIPSEWNPADGPSRGGRVGAASETVAAHKDRAARRGA